MEKFKRMVMRATAGVGMGAVEFLLVPVGISEDELNDYAWQSAVQLAESYGLEPDTNRGFYNEDAEREEDDEFDNRFTNDIDGRFEDYDPEEHDGLRIGGDTSWREM